MRAWYRSPSATPRKPSGSSRRFARAWRHEPPLGGVRAAKNSTVSVRTPCLLPAKPTAGKSRSVAPDGEIGTLPHQTPDETGAKILDHQDDGPLVDAEVIRRNPELRR